MQIIGHQRIIGLLERSLESDKRGQAYIFTGPREVGKFTVASAWARELVLGKRIIGSKEDSAERGAMDIDVISPEKAEKRGVVKEKDISIEQVREAQKRLANFAYHGRFRVLIVDEADRMTQGAQNALLKTLEEPNSSSIIILVTSRPGRIIPTIRSRSQSVSFQLVPESELEDYCRSLTDPEQASRVVRFSMGRPGRAARMLADKEEIGWHENSEELLERMTGGRLADQINTIGELSKDVPEALRHLEFWLWQIHAGRTVERLVLAERINQGIEALRNTQANPRLVLEQIFIR